MYRGEASMTSPLSAGLERAQFVVCPGNFISDFSIYASWDLGQSYPKDTRYSSTPRRRVCFTAERWQTLSLDSAQ